MSQAAHHQTAVEETIETVLAFAVKAVDAERAEIGFMRRGRIETVAAIGDPAIDHSAEPDEVTQGPDVDMIGRHAIIVRDTRAENRWPTWSAWVCEHGVRSYLCVPMILDTDLLGHLRFYDTRPEHFDRHDSEVAHIFARHATVALAQAKEREGLLHAIDSRKLIGQAQGILMERYGLDADRAFSVLARYSQDHNIKLRVLAERLVDTRRLPQQ